MKLMVKIDILDSDGNAEYDYEENYCMEVKDAPDDIAGEFRQRVKKAVIEVAKTDVEMARYIVENLGYAYSHKEDQYDSFEEYVLDNFPVRGVGHLPPEVLEKNGITLAPDPDAVITSYDDCGMFDE